MRQLSIETFGRRLLDTLDLDPVYVMLEALPLEQRKRWCVAYWLYYSCGAASKAADSEDFWGVIRSNLKGVRGTERRHFRGQIANKAVEELSRSYPDPIQFVNVIAVPPLSFGATSKVIQQFYGFGQWISFKVCDMLERCLLYPVSAADCDLTWYRDPVLGAERACAEWHVDTDKPVAYAVERLLKEFQGHLAPPRQDRPLNVQEIETVLCKWKSHRNGHYYVGKDTIEVHHSLATYRGATADCLRGKLDGLLKRFRLV